jgi:hypothetical protein
MKNSVNCILIGLASFDIVLITTSILMFGVPSIYTYSIVMGYVRSFIGRHFQWRIFSLLVRIIRNTLKVYRDPLCDLIGQYRGRLLKAALKQQSFQDVFSLFY